ncbi:MAG: hypothetical protein AAGD18_03030 [Actinomycetota bacterium]
MADGFGVDDLETSGLAGGAVGERDGTVWYLAEDEVDRALGPALALARQRSADQLHLLVDGDAGLVARLASYFADPPRVWRVEGRSLESAVPRAPSSPPPVPDDLDEQIAVLRAAGCDVIVEHGVVTGEAMGLEVARILDDELGRRVEVGVGAHDREAFQMLHGDRPTVEALADVVGTVRAHRSHGAEPHPLNRLRAERWLRALVMAAPDSVGADHLDPLPPPEPQTDLRARTPAAAIGVDPGGRPLVAVCSVGIDVDLVPQAADARALVGDDAELVVVVPARDAHPLTGDLVGRLTSPARIVALPGDWRSLGAAAAR